MDRFDVSVCIHCNHAFDLKNLSKERRRSLVKCTEFDIINVLSVCYCIDEFKFKGLFSDNIEKYYVCVKCFNLLKSIYQTQCKRRQLEDNLRNCASPVFKTLQSQHDSRHVTTIESTPVPALTCKPNSVTPSTGKKRNRQLLTPSKSGCTPKSKKPQQTPMKSLTPKKNRRRLDFKTPVAKFSSPGPKVKVHVKFNGSSRNTQLRGKPKMACKAIVQKQYKTALNHLLEVDQVKMELANAIQKKILEEARDICKDNKSVFRSSNITSFSWKSAAEELSSKCPLTLQILKTIASPVKKQIPRLVTSLAVLLFTRNQKMNAIQTINSVLMYRGHVRTRVYNTFNRAGISSSYKTTLSSVDKISTNFDVPVKQWAKAVADHAMRTSTPTTNTVMDDHAYASPMICEQEDSSPPPAIEGIEISKFQIPEPPTFDEDLRDLIEVQGNLRTDMPYVDDSEMENDVPSTPMQATSQSGNQNNLGMESPFTTTASEAVKTDASFAIIMDNLNLQQKTRHKTLDTSNKTYNLVHSMAVQNRVYHPEKDATHPQADILSIPNDAFIPNEQDYRDLYSDWKVLIQRALVDYIPALKDFKDVVVYHIPHQFSTESEQKSNIVPLGILEKDENVLEQMIEVVEHLQQYVPRTDHGKMLPILLGGDALSVERGESARKSRMDGFTPEDRLEGFEWKSEDWHAHIISLQESFSLLYKGSSAGERGTLFQIRNLFDRRGVKSEVTNAVNDCREFIRFATIGYIILAALYLLGVDSLEEVGTKVADIETSEAKQEFLKKLSDNIVKTYLQTEQFDFKETMKDVPVNNDNSRVKCGYVGCSKTFSVNGRCRQKHREKCLYKDLEILDSNVNNDDNQPDTQPTSSQSSKILKEDFKLNYVCNVLREGLMDWTREDAAKENDGERLVRVWRFDMLRFSMTNHTKYRLLAFRLQSQLMALLPPKMAHELKHNRCVNIHGGKGCNVPGDLALEFLNMRAKDALSCLGGNLTSASIQRSGRSLQGLNDIIDSYSKGLDVYFGKPSNSKPSIQKDVNMFVEKLKEENLFEKCPGRYFKSFPTMNFNVLDKLDGQKLSNWLSTKKEDYAKLQRVRSYRV